MRNYQCKVDSPFGRKGDRMYWDNVANAYYTPGWSSIKFPGQFPDIFEEVFDKPIEETELEKMKKYFGIEADFFKNEAIAGNVLVNGPEDCIWMEEPLANFYMAAERMCYTARELKRYLEESK